MHRESKRGDQPEQDEEEEEEEDKRGNVQRYRLKEHKLTHWVLNRSLDVARSMMGSWDSYTLAMPRSLHVQVSKVKISVPKDAMESS